MEMPHLNGQGALMAYVNMNVEEGKVTFMLHPQHCGMPSCPIKVLRLSQLLYKTFHNNSPAQLISSFIFGHARRLWLSPSV